MAQTTLNRPRIITTAHRRSTAVVTLVSLLCAGLLSWAELPRRGTPPHPDPRFGSVTTEWPSQGQSAIKIDGHGRRASGPEAPVPIASVAKVMTAYVVLRAFPLAAGQAGFTLSFTQADSDDARADKADSQSSIPVISGETMTERQALEALLLPSANNIAHALAEHPPGGETGFVAAMNQRARALHMDHTVYTDPSGLDPGTTSTALDQLRLARSAMRLPAFASIVAMQRAVLPVAGMVANTDTLLGHDGFVGIKTGSTSAAGGCFMFEARQERGGRSHALVGVVLGQRGGPLIQAALNSARRVVRGTMAQLA